MSFWLDDSNAGIAYRMLDVQSRVCTTGTVKMCCPIEAHVFWSKTEDDLPCLFLKLPQDPGACPCTILPFYSLPWPCVFLISRIFNIQSGLAR